MPGFRRTPFRVRTDGNVIAAIRSSAQVMVPINIHRIQFSKSFDFGPLGRRSRRSVGTYNPSRRSNRIGVKTIPKRISGDYVLYPKAYYSTNWPRCQAFRWCPLSRFTRDNLPDRFALSRRLATQESR